MDEDIDISNIIKILISNRLTIFIVTLIFSISSVIYSLSIDNVYRSDSLIQIIDNNHASNSMLSQYSGVASLAGINLPSSSQNKSALVIEIIKSRSFFNVIILDEYILPKIIAYDKYDQENNTDVYNSDIYSSKDGWNIQNQRPSTLDAHSIFLNMLNIEEDSKSGFIKISIDHESPLFAKLLLNSILKNINLVIKHNDIKDSNESINFLKSEISKTNTVDIKNGLSNILEKQLEKNLLANVRDEYIVKIIDPPHTPEKKYSPKRSTLVILISIFGFLASIIFVIFRDSIQNIK